MGKRTFVVAVALALMATACTSGSSSGQDNAGTKVTTVPSAGTALQIRAVSTRPEYVTGGDVLLAVTASDDGGVDGVVVFADGRDVTSAFHRDGDRLVGLVDGLPDGDARIEATRHGAGSAKAMGALTVTNHPITGPLFSGPHQSPYVCTTELIGLGPPTDGECSAPTTTRTEQVEPGITATIESGVIDRSAYTIAFPVQGWNGRLVYRFGGGCGTSFSQGRPLGVQPIDPDLLAHGYAIATSTLNTFQTACNDVLSAEAALMVKEHFIETHGEVVHTIGQGGSGGAIQQLLIAQNYPGILDALSPSLPFPDAISIAGSVSDCGLLQTYYASPAGPSLTQAQQQAINGHLTVGTCGLWAFSFLSTIDPTTGCDPALASQVYDAETRPRGVRCTLQDSNVNILGTDPATGFANRPLSNVGVQYGLAALNDAAITPEQFVALNEHIGGYDIDGEHQAAREDAPDAVFRDAYANGRVITGVGLKDVPIILTNIYTDPKGDIHDRQRAFTIRARLQQGAQTDPNAAIWTFDGAGGDLISSLTGAADGGNESIFVLDQWLTAADADASDAPWPDKLTATRPAEAVDRCVTPDGQTITGPDTYTSDNACTQAYPVSSDPRRVAGAPLVNDILRCQLKPIDTADYEVPMDPGLVERLRAAFPSGVCDWTQPGVGQVPLSRTWITYG